MKTDSILQSVKKVVGYPVDYTDFDVDLLMFINTEFAILHQHGVGPTEPFVVTGDGETWGDFSEDPRLNFIETLLTMRAKLLFDRPENSFAIELLKETIKELEWRANIVSETVE